MVPTWTVEVNGGDRSAFLFFEEQLDAAAAPACGDGPLETSHQSGCILSYLGTEARVAQE